jgi:hypothetical protein
MSKIKDKYKIIHDPKDPKKWCVELLSPCAPFHGIVISYGEFRVNEADDTRSKPTFTYETDIVYVPERLRGVTFPDSSEKEIQTLLGQILFDILNDNLENTKADSGKLYLELQPNDKR